MKKATRTRSFLVVPAILTIALLLSACSSEEARLPAAYSYSPGASFATNINDEDIRRVVRCTVVFEVIDEEATIDLVDYNFIIRDAVLKVLGELTMEELTVDKDLDEIAQRLVDRTNEAIDSKIDFIIGAYFTEFSLS